MISIVIPTYNSVDKIEECLFSISQQVTGYNYEIIIVNDGSTDGTLDKLNDFKRNNTNLKISIYTIDNSGPGLARNYGISKASSKYIWFVDDDDYLSCDNAIESISIELNHHKPDIYIFNAKEINQKGDERVWSFTKKTTMTNISESPNLYLKQQWPWNKIINREFLLNSKILFDDRPIFEDIYFFSKLYSEAEKIYLTPNIYYSYVKGPNSITSSLKNYNTYPRALLHEFKCYIKTLLKKN